MMIKMTQSGLDPRDCAYIDGQWQNSRAASDCPSSIRPRATPFSYVVAGDRSDLDRAVVAARAAFPALRQRLWPNGWLC
jgi:acyl-CoA reductase-like NAD-dependent aldehyde dehydrogenase